MPQTLEPSDGELLRRMWAGQEEAFTALYRRHQAAVYRFALHMSGRTETAEEVTQEVFMLLMSGRKQYDPARGALLGWLYGVARNHVLKAVNQDRPYAAGIEEADPSDLPVADVDVLGDITRTEQIESLRQAILVADSVSGSDRLV